MKLRNKRTGGLANIMGDQDFFRVYTDAGWHDYDSLAELNEEWEDYEEKPKRYRLKKDLPTFKAGEIFEIYDSNLYKVNETDEDTEFEVMAYHKQTLERFPNILTDWFEPVVEKNSAVEPLIKDEKVRKAVRAWAEACGAKQIKYSIAPNQYYDADMGTGFSIKFLTKPVEVYLEEGKIYTIAELCGEEEE